MWSKISQFVGGLLFVTALVLFTGVDYDTSGMLATGGLTCLAVAVLLSIIFKWENE